MASHRSRCTRPEGDHERQLVVQCDDPEALQRADALDHRLGLSLELPEGNYSADATLIDASGTAISFTLPLDALRVVRDAELTINLDFPAASIP